MVKVQGAIHYGMIVAHFLSNTKRVVQAVQLWNECLILLNNQTLENEHELAKIVSIALYKKLFYGNAAITKLSPAIEYGKKLLVLLRNRKRKKEEGNTALMLSNLYFQKSEYQEAQALLKIALCVYKKIEDKSGEASCYGNLGAVFQSVGEYAKAEEYLHKALPINTEIGDRKGEASCYINLGSVFHSVGEYAKAEEYLHKALSISTAIGNREGEASCYINLGNVFKSVGEYAKAEEYLHKALPISTEIGDKHGKASCYLNLGNVFTSVGEYAKAEEYLHKALSISTAIGDREGEASCYINLGNVFKSVGEYAKAEEYLHKALPISIEIGDRKGEASCYIILGAVFHSVGEYAKAEEYVHKALPINTEIGDREGESTCFINLGGLFTSVREYAKAKEYLNKGLTMKTEIGDKEGEAACYLLLGTVTFNTGECEKAQKYFENALEISRDTGNNALQFETSLVLSKCSFKITGNKSEALSNLRTSIQICEKMLISLGSNDCHNISFFDKSASPYRLFCSLSCFSGKPYEALHVAELGRARALAELMSNRYSVEKEISVNPQSFVCIEEVIKKNGNSTCLYISNDYDNNIFLWVLKQSKPVAFRRMKLCKSYPSKHGKISVYDLFGNESFLRKFHVLPQEQCEDRSLFSSFANQRPLLDENEVNTDPEPPTLLQVYDMLISPVSDLLEGSEIIVVPDNCFFQVPFAALHDESNRYLSDSFRIRIIPSLTTLKLILDSPADSHSETGALIVGEPSVMSVYFKGELGHLCPLPGAKAEAEMIARLLPQSHLLIGEQATKQAVLQRIPSVSLVHIAAHGNAERGEIALTPPDSAMRPPHEADYLLTMTDISQVRISAKLVVLSCCHTARGQIKTEGVVGIARAFLGSGARSVLVALWALQDRATEQFMRRFYENLIEGESASECLHRAMKWMRNNGFPEVRQWAPFMLIGDDVSFHFGEEK